jgi:hypothetical protein
VITPEKFDRWEKITTRDYVACIGFMVYMGIKRFTFTGAMIPLTIADKITRDICITRTIAPLQCVEILDMTGWGR